MSAIVASAYERSRPPGAIWETTPRQAASTKDWTGFAPSLPTPFRADLSVDFSAFERLCDRQIRAGATALVVCEIEGESPTLTPDECQTLIRAAVGAAGGRALVIAGAGSNCTADAISLTRDAERAGADAVISVAPYYSKPGQRGLLAHFSAIFQSTRMPIFLGDAPARTACAVTDETVARLAEFPNCAGLYDASGDVGRLTRLASRVRTDFRLLAGDDRIALAFLQSGGHGFISALQNVAPVLCQNLEFALGVGDVATIRNLSVSFATLAAELSEAPSPVAVKFALSRLGLVENVLRLPLVPLGIESHAAVEAAMEAALASNQTAEFDPDWRAERTI